MFVSSSIGNLETAFEKQGYSSLFIDFHGDVEVLKEKVRFLKRRFVDGLVFFFPRSMPNTWNFSRPSTFPSSCR